MKFNNRSYFLFDNIYPFLALIFIALFTNFYHYDEGIVAQRVEDFYINNTFFSIHEINIVFGRFVYVIMSKINPDPTDINNYFFNRAISLFSALSIFFIIQKILKNYFSETKNFHYILLFLIFFWIGFTSGGLTARQDLTVALISTYSFLSICNLIVKNSKINFYISTTLSICLMSYHPNFLPVILINLFFFCIFFFKTKDLKFFFNFFLSSLIGLILFLYLYTLGNLNIENIKSLISVTLDHMNLSLELSYVSTSGNLSIYKNIKSEFIDLIRLNHLNLFHSDAYLIYISLIFVNLFTILKIKKFNKVEYILLTLIIFNLIFLAVIPNKWLHHLTSVWILQSIFCLVFFKNFFQFMKKYNFKFLLIFLLIFFISFKFYNYINNNTFLYKSLYEKNIINKKNILFKNSFKNLQKIEKINVFLRNKNFAGNPIIQKIFPDGNYIGYVEPLINNKSNYIVVLPERWHKSCENKYINPINDRKLIFKLNNFNNIVCEKVK